MFNRDRLDPDNSSPERPPIVVCPQTYKDALDGFAESAKVAIDVLSQLAEIHPFIKAPVIAFKLVVTLDLKRRDNDAKVLAVKVEMQSMLTVLVQLRNIEDTQDLARDAGLKVLLHQIEESIKDAGSLCDWYTKKSMIRKYLKSVIYEARLAECAKHFVEFGIGLQRALSIHTVIGVDAANTKLDEQNTQLQGIQQQMQDIFLLLESPHEKEIRNLIQSSGGARASIMDNKVLQTLVDKSEEITVNISSRGGQSLQETKEALLTELSEDVDKVLQQNLVLFLGKLDIQFQELENAIATQGDRIIAFLTGGHDRIFDPGWKSTVKSRHFVLALRDHYLSLFMKQSNLGHDIVESGQSPFPHYTTPDVGTTHSLTPEATPNSNDTWTTAYFNMSYIQAISEAIDDDGSGFINVQEVNDFTTSRPLKWSVFQWLAFWAAGWQSSISIYTEKIYRLLRKMYKLRDKVRPDNFAYLDEYLRRVEFYRLELLLESPTKAVDPLTPELVKLRDEFCRTEEVRLTANLDKISDFIDSSATVSLVTGPGRIERYIYPLIYLLLKGHIRTIQLASRHSLDYWAFRRGSTSLRSIFSAFDSRRDDLAAIFKQMNIEPQSHFKNHAFGMFNTSWGDLRKSFFNDRLSPPAIWDRLPQVPGEDDNIDTFPGDNTKKEIQFSSYYDVLENLLLDSVPNTLCSDEVRGTWAGFFLEAGDGLPFEGTFRLIFDAVRSEDGWVISPHIATTSGPIWMKYDVSGIDKSEVEIVLFRPYEYRMRCIGLFDPALGTISGQWYKEEASDGLRPQTLGFSTELPSVTGTFQLSRTPYDLVRFRYGAEAFKKSPAKARWFFARDAILYTIRRDRFARPYVVSHLRNTRRLVELVILDSREPLHIRELKELQSIISPPMDEWYYFVGLQLQARINYHRGAYCNGPNCPDNNLGRTRHMCIVCSQPYNDTMDLCTSCRGTGATEKFPTHNVSHSLLRSHRAILDWDQDWMVPKAVEMSERIKEKFRHGPSNIADNDSLACAICQKVVALPCWVCLKCEPDRLVCNSCDMEHQTPPPVGKMTDMSISEFESIHGLHAMLWIRDDQSVVIPNTDQLTRVEDRLSGMEALVKNQLGEAATRFAGVERQLDEQSKVIQSVIQSVGHSVDHRLSSLESRFDSLETLLREFIVASRTT
ncbi:hypothetical protein DXG01_005482 [Tephrocybe rancida]|nr:hypothetical protein DXG01_005482 [Tephrocybe rancida]